MGNEYSDRLIAFFHEVKVAKFESIQRLSPVRSRSSILRDLKCVSYLTSYNHAGGYYTLADIPNFDSDGIWQYKDAYFSVYGSLRSTAKQLIDNSKNGRTHDELRQKLCVRIQNTLLELTSANEIMREKYKGAYLYTSSDEEKRSKQLEKRKGDVELSVDPYTIIEVLRAVIKNPDQQAIAIRGLLKKDGVRISIGQVEAVFNFYELGKKKPL